MCLVVFMLYCKIFRNGRQDLRLILNPSQLDFFFFFHLLTVWAVSCLKGLFGFDFQFILLKIFSFQSLGFEFQSYWERDGQNACCYYGSILLMGCCMSEVKGHLWEYTKSPKWGRAERQPHCSLKGKASYKWLARSPFLSEGQQRACTFQWVFFISGSAFTQQMIRADGVI